MRSRILKHAAANHTNRSYYLFALTGGTRARLARKLPLEKKFRVADWRELGSAEFPYDTTRFYDLKVENTGSRIRAFVDDTLLIDATDEAILGGKAGLTADVPARFADFRVTASSETEHAVRFATAPRHRASPP
ncbi:MAG: hypothetical protein GEU99_23250 [Luteitalea sp.]|nr:hypothetical protein [Luteitalea sp.]